MSTAGRLFAPEGSRVRGFAEAVAWLWRLGPVCEVPEAGAVGFGWLEDAAELEALVAERALAGAVIFAPRPGPAESRVPGRERIQGVAEFGPGERVVGQFTVLHGSTPAVSSSLGVHATREPDWMVAGIDPDAAWGTLDGFWLYGALAEFLAQTLSEPLLMLPALGWFRYDDAPGNAYDQLVGRDHDDAYWRKRIRRLGEAFSEAGAVANLAISAKGLRGERLVPLDELWPKAIEEIRGGLESGVFEAVVHGYSHLRPAEPGENEGDHDPHEFRDMPEPQAAERVDESLAWLEGLAGSAPRTFVAPNWSYGAGLTAALRERNMAAWLPVRPGPLVEGNFARETLLSTLNGLHQLDYGPFSRLAQAGMPPTIVIHGGLFDSRMKQVRWLRSPGTLARLAWRRDMFRVPWTGDVRWVGASELFERLSAHDLASVGDGEARLPAGAEAILYDGVERRLVRG